MSAFTKITQGIDVVPTLLALNRQPELWDEFTERKTAPGTPHSGMSDIWLRYRAREELTEPARYGEPHVPVFYPAWDRLPSLRPIVFNLMAYMSAVQLGGVMITRIPPGGQIDWHDDRGSWHAEFFNCKVYVPLQANDLCLNLATMPGKETEIAVMKPGEAWSFDNLIPHAVENGGDTDRITLITCMRIE
jgi:hypothetical protein